MQEQVTRNGREQSIRIETQPPAQQPPPGQMPQRNTTDSGCVAAGAVVKAESPANTPRRAASRPDGHWGRQTPERSCQAEGQSERGPCLPGPGSTAPSASGL